MDDRRSSDAGHFDRIYDKIGKLEQSMVRIETKHDDRIVFEEAMTKTSVSTLNELRIELQNYTKNFDSRFETKVKELEQQVSKGVMRKIAIWGSGIITSVSAFILTYWHTIVDVFKGSVKSG